MTLNTYQGMTRERLEELLKRMSKISVGVLCDVCLDVYWHADLRISQLSRETPHFPLPVRSERMSLGGGGNVAVNLAALRPKSVSLFSAIGNDWRGSELMKLLVAQNIGVSGVIADDRLITNAYIKPIRHGISSVAYEDPRLDFANTRRLPHEVEDAVIDVLEKAAGNLDVLCVSDQMTFGVITERVREYIAELSGSGLRVVADSRANIGKFSGVILKPNEMEGALAAGLNPDELQTPEDYARVAAVLAEKAGCPVFMTIGAQGSLYVDDMQAWHMPSHKIDGPIDIVGAGDSSLSGFAISLAANAEPWEAAYIAGLCSEVTVQQTGITGSASAEQILEWHALSSFRDM